MAENWSDVLKTMNERRKRGELCDFRIIVEGETFSVHRLVLETCSEYFRMMFASNMRESNEGVCELKDTKANAARICINFLYTGELEDITVDTAQEVLSLSHMWQLNKVVQKCQEVLSKNLDVERCFDSWRIAKLYKLGPLLDDCIRFIFSNLRELREYVSELTRSELVEIVKMQKLDLARGYNLEYLWSFCTQWTLQRDCVEEFCQIAILIPFGHFSYPVFRNTIWKHPYIRDCDSCRKSVSLTFLQSDRSVTVENCLFLTHLANCYDQGQGERISKFIAQNSEAVFAYPDFAQFVTEQNLLDYLSRLNRKKCSKREWSSIITWLKFDSNREEIFPKIFKDDATMGGRNTFLESLRSFDSRIGTFQQALYIKTVALKYSCKTAENSADNLIVEQFSRVVLSPEYSHFSSKDLIKYVENPKIYSAGETLIWDAILNWVNADCEARTKEFPAIFRSLQLQKFSVRFLRQTVCNSRVVTEHPDCVSRIVRFLFVKLHQGEINNRSDKEELDAMINLKTLF